jgi:hypothetical protein
MALTDSVLSSIHHGSITPTVYVPFMVGLYPHTVQQVLEVGLYSKIPWNGPARRRWCRIGERTARKS